MVPPNFPYEIRHIPNSEHEALALCRHLLLFPFRYPFDLLASHRENRAFREGMATAWSYCETVWNKPYVDVQIRMPLFHSPYGSYPSTESLLLRRFSKAFSNAVDFLADKVENERPVIAAYAAMCFQDANQLPRAAFDRYELIVIHDRWVEVELPFFAFAEKLVNDHNEAAKYFETSD